MAIEYLIRCGYGSAAEDLKNLAGKHGGSGNITLTCGLSDTPFLYVRQAEGTGNHAKNFRTSKN
jgi:hypothetical protein